MSKILSPNKSKILGDKYKLGDEIGRGASGRVFKGLDLQSGDFVAIKQLSLENISQEDLDVIMQEIDLLKVLNHKNIVKYLGTLNTETDLHIILEYVENGSLDNIIKPNKFGPLPESLAAVYIAQVLEGLVYLHEQGVIHRDIKGANILATKEGHVKLTDFGVATKLTEAGVNTNSSSVVVGTPYWMAPEVIELSGACAQSDIWSVGCTVIELITSFPPHHDLGHYTALYRIVKDEMPPIPAHLSPELTDFLHQCFKKDAKQRPDAKILLLHPWLRNSSRSFQSSVRKVSARISGIPAEVSMDSEGSSGDDQGSSESNRDASDSEREHEDFVIVSEKDVIFEQDPLVASHQKPSMAANSGISSSDIVDVSGNSEGYSEKSHMISLDVGKSDGGPSSPNSRKESSVTGELAAEGKNALRPRIRKRSTRKTVDDKLNAEGPLSLQDAEINKLLGFLKPEASEDEIVSACKKLNNFFQEYPDQKIAFVTQHGLLPLVDLLEVRKIPVISSVLQIINQIIKDNSHFQEYACSLGLIPVVMNFATPDRPNEVRMHAAYFLQELCESSSCTLQMFIACRGIPVLVGFLETDYAKRREMVHLAVDGMWQIFKLPRLTQRNDFCRIAAMNGILSRLVNTLHSLNEAIRITSSSGNSSFTASGSARQQSLPKDRSQYGSTRGETPKTEDLLALQNLETSRQLVSHDQARASVTSISPRSSTEQQQRNSMSSASIKFTSQECRRLNSWGRNSSLAEDDLVRQQGGASPARLSSSKSLKQAPNGIANSSDSQQKQLLPVMSLLEKEPPSRLGSRKFVYPRQSSALLRQGSGTPLLLKSPERSKTDELDRLMTEFAEVSRHGREMKNPECNTSIALETESNKISATSIGLTSFNERTTSHAGTSQETSDTLSGSGVLNARPGCNESSGLLPKRTTTDKSVAREYLEKIADLLLEFAQADTTVKSHMCRINLLNRLFYLLKKLEFPILLKILRCINHLSTDANCLENLQRVNAIKHLVPHLELCEHPLVPQIDNEVLSTLFNLCKINKTMQEQAAENGIVPYLMRLIMSDSPLKQYALPLLCDMAQASSSSREQLRACGGLEVYLSLLDDNSWAMTALDSLAACLAYDNDSRKIEQELLKNGAIKKLVKFFQSCPEQYFMNILEPFLKILRKSPRINTTLAVNGLTSLLVERLNNQDAIVRINLLKMIKSVYEYHPRPKQLIVENDLPQKLERLIEEQNKGAQRSGGQVLVKQLATALLKALHINTVL